VACDDRTHRRRRVAGLDPWTSGQLGYDSRPADRSPSESHDHRETGLRGGDACARIRYRPAERNLQFQPLLLAERLGRIRLTNSDAEALYAQTAGNPLFVVEAMRAGGDLLTPRVQAVIESRFAQLSPEARTLVDVAATIGREFAAQVLSSATHADEETVVRGLDELWRRRIIREHNAVAYDFSHDTIREVAYGSLSPVRRRHLHRQVALALEQAYAHDLDGVSGRLARHHEEAGQVEQAVAWYTRAADVAQRVYAHDESARLLWRAIELVRRLPPAVDRERRELELLTALPAPLIASEGYALPRVAEMHQRALELARSLGVDLAPPLLRSMALGALAHGDFSAARGFGLQLRDRGEQTGDDVLRVESEYVLGVTAFWAAEMEQARTHLENALALYRDEHRAEHLLCYAQDPKVICLTRLGCTLWWLGDSPGAVRARDEGLAHAERIGHPYSRSVGLLFGCLLSVDMGDVPALRELLARLEAGDAAVAAAQTWSSPTLCGRTSMCWMAASMGSPGFAGCRPIHGWWSRPPRGCTRLCCASCSRPPTPRATSRPASRRPTS
jgi:tetratricopeptide (TPR) repeat protein